MLQDDLFDEIKDGSVYEAIIKYGIEYIHSAFSRNVFPDKDSLSDLNIFDEKLQDEHCPSLDVLNLLHTRGAPASVAQIGGRFFGFVDGGVVPAGLGARLLSDFWDQNTAVYSMSPIASKLESVVEAWLVDLFDLPSATKASFVSGSSMATFCGLAAARNSILRKNNWDVNKKGLAGAPSIRIITGDQVHSTVVRAVSLLGMGTDCIEYVQTDDQGRIIPSKIPELDGNSILILQAGNVNTGSYDDFYPIIEDCKAKEPWIHIDGAFGLLCAAVDELKHLTRGIRMADSWSFDGHKALNTPYDNGILLCRDEEALKNAMAIAGSYLNTDGNRNGILFTPEMSRRARIIELWATLKSLGKAGISEMIYTLHLRARQFADEIRKAGFEVLNDIHFNQVLVYYESNESTMDILKKVQDSGVCWCGSSKWQSRDVIRISVCSWATTEDDISMSVEAFKSAKKSVLNRDANT